MEYISNDLGASVNGTPAEKFVELRATGVFFNLIKCILFILIYLIIIINVI